MSISNWVSVWRFGQKINNWEFVLENWANMMDKLTSSMENWVNEVENLGKLNGELGKINGEFGKINGNFNSQNWREEFIVLMNLVKIDRREHHLLSDDKCPDSSWG